MSAVLYLTPDEDRFFLVPPECHLPVGDLVVESVTGERRHVDEAAIAPFEVDEDRIREWLTARVSSRTRQDVSGREIDAVLERVEQRLGRWVGIDREREKRRREQEYERSARTAIADALRSAGIEPSSGQAGPVDRG